MKYSDYYIKLFIGLLIIAALLQVYLFIGLNIREEGQIHPERNQNRVMKIEVLKELIEDNIHFKNGFGDAKKNLQQIINRTGKLYNAKIWIEDSNGLSLLESFSPKDRPVKITSGYHLNAKFGDVTISHFFQKNGSKLIYTYVPLVTETGNGLCLFILYEGEVGRYKSQFLIGLAGIIFVMTILALSIVQFMRVKINRFKKSVQKISDGDLSHRIDIRGRGVVEDLGSVFNSMTDKLEKMVASSTEITANVSHEIRTPLARIRVVEDLLRKKFGKGDFSSYEKHLNNIREDVQVLDDLTGRLLEFVKLDRYQTISKDEQFNPSDLINDLIIRFEPVIESKNLNIKKELSFSSQITGNMKALISAFLNILDNAFKYAPEHGEISIITGSRQEFFEVSITNSFEKIDEKDLENIFKPFERARQSDSAGSGLGLAITKKIIEKHGGSIIAMNSKDGFEIQVRLPL